MSSRNLGIPGIVYLDSLSFFVISDTIISLFVFTVFPPKPKLLKVAPFRPLHLVALPGLCLINAGTNERIISIN